MKKPLSLRLALTAGLLLLLVVGDSLFGASLAFAAGDDASKFQETLDKGWVWAYLVAFGTGVLTSLTPCVYPMIPITVAIFGSKDEGTSRKKAFVLAACYVSGMGLLFAVLGTAFAMAGKTAGAGTLLANPYVVIPLCLLFVVLATSLFGAFDLRLPTALQNRLNQVGGKGYGGAFAMGLVGGLIAAPCTGPFLASMLVWVSSTGRPVVGATLLYTYALGVGTLFFVLAVTSMSLKRSGPWMETAKSIGGIGILLVAVHFLRPIWPQIESLSNDLIYVLGTTTTLLLVGLGIFVVGIAIGAAHLSFHSGRATQLRKAAGILVVVVGGTLAVSGLTFPDKILDWRHDEAVAYADAKASGKGVMVDFGANWCAPCKQIEKALGDAKIFDEVNGDFVPLKFDVSDNSDANDALKERYKAQSLPALLFLDADGNELVRFNSKDISTETIGASIRKAKTALRAKSS